MAACPYGRIGSALYFAACVIYVETKRCALRLWCADSCVMLARVTGLSRLFCLFICWYRWGRRQYVDSRFIHSLTQYLFVSTTFSHAVREWPTSGHHGPSVLAHTSKQQECDEGFLWTKRTVLPALSATACTRRRSNYPLPFNHPSSPFTSRFPRCMCPIVPVDLGRCL